MTNFRKWFEFAMVFMLVILPKETKKKSFKVLERVWLSLD